MYDTNGLFTVLCTTNLSNCINHEDTNKVLLYLSMRY